MGIGGYTIVADALNKAYDWPHPVSRQLVEAWHKRRTPNKARQLPPSAVRENRNPPRTTPRWEFETSAWVTWAAAGVRGPRRKGWVIPASRGDA